MRLALSIVALLALVGCDRDAICLTCTDGAAGPADGSTESGTDSGVHDSGPPADVGVPCTDAGMELCNGLDDDCDGIIDNGFDLTTDVRNCGTCGHQCIIPNATVSCVASACMQTGCLEGFADLNHTSDDGCEYRCPVFPPTAELCNGIDDDCNGMIDDGTLPDAPMDLCRTTPGTPCAGVTATCQTRHVGTTDVTTYYCNYPATVEFDPTVPNGIVLSEARCDGQDGDCDGVPDDSFPNLGNACDDGGIGACQGTGSFMCSADHTTTTCTITSPGLTSPGTELCNGIDDDCDGTIDDHVVDDMVHVMHGGTDVWIYRYEASRPDGSATSAGSDHARSCSVVNRLPWTSISFEDAQTACAASGKRLCTAAEWQAACQGAAGNLYPYGMTYAVDSCNGADHDAIPATMSVDHAVMPTGSLMSTCASADGAQDLSGNVKEWTNDMQGTVSGSAIYVVRGGSDESPELGLTCTTNLSRATHDTLLSTLGYRCCANAPDAP